MYIESILYCSMPHAKYRQAIKTASHLLHNLVLWLVQPLLMQERRLAGYERILRVYDVERPDAAPAEIRGAPDKVGALQLAVCLPG